jgi:hypothetical protein
LILLYPVDYPKEGWERYGHVDEAQHMAGIDVSLNGLIGSSAVAVLTT